MGRIDKDKFVLFTYPLPTALDPPINENGTVTPAEPGSGSDGALVSWGFRRRAAGKLLRHPTCSRSRGPDSQRWQVLGRGNPRRGWTMVLGQ